MRTCQEVLLVRQQINGLDLAALDLKDEDVLEDLQRRQLPRVLKVLGIEAKLIGGKRITGQQVDQLHAQDHVGRMQDVQKIILEVTVILHFSLVDLACWLLEILR